MKVFKNIRNITLSGKAANGATTLSKMLAKEIGWQLINGGELVRKHMKEKRIALENTSQTQDRFHIELDNFIKEKLRNESFLIIESWLSGFDGRNINGVYKIFIDCSDINTRIDRITKRDDMTLIQAKNHLEQREKENMEKWKKIYKTTDFWNFNKYDLVIDTAVLNPKQALDKILEHLNNQ